MKQISPQHLVVTLLIFVVSGALAVYVFWPIPTPARFRQQARDDFETRRWVQAEANLDQLASSGSLTPDDWMLRGLVAAARTLDDTALDYLAHVPDNHPMAPTARLKAGQIELRRDRVRTAESYFLKALALDPGLIQPHRELIYVYGMQLRRFEIDAHFRALSRLTPLTYQDAFLWGLTRTTDWQIEEIIATLRRFVAADPNDRASRLALAENLVRLGNVDEFNRVVAPLPADDPNVLALRVELALNKGNLTTAETFLKQGPTDDPGLARYRGDLALRQRDWSSAARNFRIALNANPDDRKALFGLGSALRGQGKPDEGEPVLNRARDLERLETLLKQASTSRAHTDPKLPIAIGAAYETLGRHPQAVTWYQLALKHDPFQPEAQRALHRLASQGPTHNAP
ncbi:MAG: tetratricopeptide repeat protein [Isosphaeraceae bacterium]